MSILKWAASYYILEFLVVAAAIIVTTRARRKRMRPPATPLKERWIKTDEIFSDPTTGIRQRVWYDPETGERHYVPLDE